MSGQGEFTVELSGARAVFTTRAGGVSPPPYDSLNLGLSTADDTSNVVSNRALLSERHGIGLAYGLQVHGNHVRIVGAANDSDDGPPAEGDAVATVTPGIGVMVVAADCLPIAIAGGGAVVMVHAGWRGLATDIIAAAVTDLRGIGERNARLTAAIGPGAGPCCYEVNDQLHERFARRGEGFRRGANLDLKAIASHQLQAAGVGDIEDLGLCTICSERSLFFSHRRDGGITGRQSGVAWLT